MSDDYRRRYFRKKAVEWLGRMALDAKDERLIRLLSDALRRQFDSGYSAAKELYQCRPGVD